MRKQTAFPVPLALAVLVTLLDPCPGQAQANATFRGLGNPSGAASFASTISPDGTTVVGLYEFPSQSPAIPRLNGWSFRWTPREGMISLISGPPWPMIDTSARGVSLGGAIVVGTGYSADWEAFRWTAGEGLRGLGFLPGGAQSAAYGTSGDGTVVVGYSGNASGYQEAFRWTEAGGMVGLGGFAGDRKSSAAYAVSLDGNAVVGSAWRKSLNNTEAFRWTSSAGMVGLGDLPGGAFSVASSVSADGGAVVGFSESAQGVEAFRWTASSGMVGLGDLAGGTFSSAAYGVSADGSVVVGVSKGTGGDQAFIWTPDGGMQDLKDLLLSRYGLDVSAWTLDVAKGISADGLAIAGYGHNPAGETEAWLVSLPEPASCALLAAGCLLASRRRGKRGWPVRASFRLR